MIKLVQWLAERIGHDILSPGAVARAVAAVLDPVDIDGTAVVEPAVVFYAAETVETGVDVACVGIVSS
ncbi:hypothetical protein DTL42_09700 [Bremerella cremea]|uniref:Uncharacterized protein n=1 Tax=Bremerella cremea TaxID=1031537 RepID=A0A368KSG4_9BACT|nr:hypothetical protein [Bremerella cremea]RCS51934.1 hypothetical protein DTL42_09700 [Bremerella cremea]